MVLSDIKRYAKLAKSKSNELAKQLSLQNDSKDEQKSKELNAELKDLNLRFSELNTIIKRLYEDNVTRRISDERFNLLLNDYETEQDKVKQRIEGIQKLISDLEESKIDLSAWMELIRNYTNITKLDRTILSELVDKITVSETKIIDGEKTIDITIYYRFVGAIG